VGLVARLAQQAGSGVGETTGAVLVRALSIVNDQEAVQ